jgi:hypothetical protein
MYKFKNTLIIMLLASTPWSIIESAIADEIAESYVIVADKYRQPDDMMKIHTQIVLYKNGEITKDKNYEIYVRPERKSLVIMKSASEKGQKILMLDDKFWLLMPKSRRPIRISPMQKLLGEASTGDITTLNWHEDYSAEFLPAQSNNKIDVLILSSKRKGTSYKRIKLTLEKYNHKPISAELYVASGKLAKVATYQFGQMNAREQIVSMTLADHINKNRKTVINYKSMEVYELANKFYNPAYLVKKPKIK